MELEGDYCQLVSCDAASQQQQKPAEQAQEPAGADETGTAGGKFTSDETFGSTIGLFKNFAAYYQYCGVCGMLLVTFLTVLFACCRTGSGLYLQYWIDAGDGRKFAAVTGQLCVEHLAGGMV
ncbi:uncharacterized protein LOC119101611 [Pollicipes pollicipes]|uniref:uncharacterized protein LOC119101611 n=1 Tax=Pollicipes pollicipes TaxID=41117 RepID=UPI001884EDAC|nr:uncharacterized protein LOC119101611 [Pollicipes pollicipes]